MKVNTLLVTYNGNKTEPIALRQFFSLPDKNSLWSAETLNYEDFLEKLVFSITRRPKCLITHLQRIYFCFHKNLDEQLFAAIVDFMIVLNRRGRKISRRVIMGAKPRLSADQFNTLKDYLKNDTADANLLLGNQYSILTKGMIGINKLVKHVETKNEYSHDPLDIARDHIEYSQLDEARTFACHAGAKAPKPPRHSPPPTHLPAHLLSSHLQHLQHLPPPSASVFVRLY